MRNFGDDYREAQQYYLNTGYAHPAPTSYDVRAILRRRGIYAPRDLVALTARLLGLPLADF